MFEFFVEISMKYLWMFISFFFEIENEIFQWKRFYIRISHSSSGSTKMTFRQPIGGRECKSTASNPVLWLVDEKSFQ